MCTRALETFLRSQMRHAKYREKGDGAEEGRVRERETASCEKKTNLTETAEVQEGRSLARSLAPVTIPRTLRLDA